MSSTLDSSSLWEQTHEHMKGSYEQWKRKEQSLVHGHIGSVCEEKPKMSCWCATILPSEKQKWGKAVPTGRSPWMTWSFTLSKDKLNMVKTHEKIILRHTIAACIVIGVAGLGLSGEEACRCIHGRWTQSKKIFVKHANSQLHLPNRCHEQNVAG